MRPAAMIAALLLLGACGTEVGVPGDDIPMTAQTLVGVGTVMDRGGAEFCLGGVMESLPPQCGGIPITNWDWDSLAKSRYEAVNDVRWGEFALTGTYDGERFTVTWPIVDAEDFRPVRRVEEADFSTKCPEPEGGWQPVDPAMTTPRSMDAVFRRASSLDDYAGAYMDQSLNHATSPELMNDPELTIVNVYVTGDIDSATRELREVWGGALCVQLARHTEAELRGIENELHVLDGLLTISSGIDRIDVGVTYDDGSLQHRLDDQYGAGVVQVWSALQPAT